MTRTAEEQARRLLWLFPRWMRAERGEEAVSLVLDLVPEGSKRLPLRSRLDLVRAGLHARRRGTPPFPVWSRVANADRWNVDPGVPPEWRPWLASNINRPLFLALCALHRVAFGLVYLGVMLAVSAFDLVMGAVVFGLVLLLFVAFVVFRRHRWRSAVLAANGLGADGRPLPPHQAVLAWSKAAVPNGWVLPLFGGAAVVGGVYGPVAWLQADSTESTLPLAVAAVISGLVITAAAWWAGRRLRSLATEGPAVVMAPERSNRINGSLALLMGIGIGLGWSWFGSFMALLVGFDLLLAVSGPAAAAVVVLLVWRSERRAKRAIGVWDLWPSWAPHPVVRPVVVEVEDPTSGPGTPALG